MERIRDRVAGLDVHRDTVVGCVRLAVDEDVQTIKQSFSTLSSGVAALAEWLADHEVSTVVMEATTSDYWKPFVRHEALLNRVGMRGPHPGGRRSGPLKLGAARTRRRG